MLDIKEIKVLNSKNCTCGHEFSLADVKGIERLQDAHGFYGNLVKNYSIAICPKCKKQTILLLKQTGQTWKIMNTAQVPVTQKTRTENKEENIKPQEFICPVCKKICKNKIGLNAHMKTHND